jgi:outer membrane protein TolC
MKNNLSLPISLLALAVIMFSSNAFAEIYKRVDADGRITYSNIKTKGATRLEFDPDANVISNERARHSGDSSRRTATPEGFPKVDKNTQNQRDSKRQDILQSELDSEKVALEAAKKALADAAANPEISHIKNANGSTSTFRNVAKFDEKIKNLQADVDSHENNIKLLQKELDNLR